jgi:hypothetical protein
LKTSGITLFLSLQLGIIRRIDARKYLPWQAAAIAITLLVLMGAGKLRIPRWSFVALAAAAWLIYVNQR